MTYNSLNVLSPWPALLAEQLKRWQSLMLISEAEIVLAHHGRTARAFQVKVRLEGSGPCLRSTADGTTLEAALQTATDDIESQIQVRHSNSNCNSNAQGGRRITGRH